MRLTKTLPLVHCYVHWWYVTRGYLDSGRQLTEKQALDLQSKAHSPDQPWCFNVSSSFHLAKADAAKKAVQEAQADGQQRAEGLVVLDSEVFPVFSEEAQAKLMEQAEKARKAAEDSPLEV